MDIKSYIKLLEQVLSGKLPIENFVTEFFTLAKADKNIYPIEISDILATLFAAVDDYCSDPILRLKVSGATDETTLMKKVRDSYNTLRNFRSSE
jgi:hypothetical protein